MSAQRKPKILVLPTPLIQSKEEMAEKVRKLAQDSGKVQILKNQHVTGNMSIRNVTIKQIFDVLRNGKPAGEPSMDSRGDWRIKMKKYSAGRTVQVVVALKRDSLFVITVI